MSKGTVSAESFLFNMAAKVLVKISSPIFQEVMSTWGVEGDLEKLEDTLSTVKALLLDAEEQQRHNKEHTIWLGKLKNTFYDAEDVLDEFKCKALRRSLGAAPERYVAFFLALIHLYYALRWFMKSKKSVSNS